MNHWTSTVSSCLPINYTQIMCTQSTQSIMSRVCYVNYQKTVEFVRTIFLVCWCKRNGDVDRAILIGGPDFILSIQQYCADDICQMYTTKRFSSVSVYPWWKTTWFRSDNFLIDWKWVMIVIEWTVVEVYSVTIRTVNSVWNKSLFQNSTEEPPTFNDCP